jgi:hypothetical protein
MHFLAHPMRHVVNAPDGEYTHDNDKYSKSHQYLDQKV